MKNKNSLSSTNSLSKFNAMNFKIICFFLLLTLGTSTLNAQTWTGLFSSDWSQAFNWSSWPIPVPPGATASVTIPSGTPHSPIIANVGVTVAKVTINSGATVTISSSGSLTIGSSGSDGIDNSGTLTNNGTVNIQFATDAGIKNSGTINNSGGTIAIDTTGGRGIYNNGGTINNLSSSAIQICQNGGSVGTIGIDNKAGSTFTNDNSVIGIDNTSDEGLRNRGFFDNENNGDIWIGGGSGQVNSTGIGHIGLLNELSTAEFTNDGSTLYIRNTTNIGLRNYQGAKFINQNSAIINLAQTDGTIGGNGISSNNFPTIFTNDNSIINIDNTDAHGMVNSNLGRFDNLNGATINIGLTGGVQNIGYDGIINNDATLNNDNSTIKIDNVTVDGLVNVDTLAEFTNKNGGQIEIGLEDGNISRVGLFISQSATFSNNQISSIKIDGTGVVDPSSAGIWSQNSSTFDNRGEIIIGANGISSIGGVRNLNSTMENFPGATITTYYTFRNTDASSTFTNEGDLICDADFMTLTSSTTTGSGQYTISGNWINDATFNGYGSTVSFNGSSISNIDGTSNSTFYNLEVAKSANYLQLSRATQVSYYLNLTSGNVSLGSNDLVLLSGASISAGPIQYIVAESSGRLVQEVGAGSVFYPVGTSGSYVPATLSNSGTTDNFGVSVFNDVLDGGTTGSTIPEIDNCVNNTWNITEEIAGGSDLSITAQWNLSDEGSSFDRTQSGLGHYTAGNWNPQDAAAAQGTGPYSLTRTGITSLSAFAVGDVNSPMAIQLAITVELEAFLEGPFNGTDMDMDLNTAGVLPLSQPFNTAPWNYPGTESVVTIPANTVDWVLIEIRDATDAASATPATVIERQAAFVLNDGTIRTIDGTTNPEFSSSVTQNLFVVLYHRNHLAVMSASALTESGGVYPYNFTTGEAQAYGGANGHKEIGTGIWGMIGGDTDASGTIEVADKTAWAGQAGTTGYKSGDLNMNTQVDNTDKNDVYVGNSGSSSQVPD